MTKEFWDIYKDVDIPLPKNGNGKKMLEDCIRAARRFYYAACIYVNTNISKLLKALENTGLIENIIICFIGDHGDMLGERGL
ncbi:Choline-sulfatase [Penicillium frequentans]|nr:Choline-sulfatase [Penicillium glabrum]